MNTATATFASNPSPQLLPGAPMPEPQVHRQNSLLAESIVELIEAFKVVGNRLGPVLRQEPPAPAPQGGTATTAIGEVLVPLASVLAGHREKIQGLTRELHSIANRLEV